MSVNVVFMKGSLAGMRFHIPDAGAVVGRSHSCGIRASESDVSGRHVQIVPAGNGAEMTVLSAHRAFVNGRRVPSGAKTGLKSGDHIRLGESLEFAFMVDNSADNDAGDSTSLFPETGAAGGGTRATLGTRATMATQATMATGAMNIAADDASTSDAVAAPQQGTRGGTPPPRMGILRSQRPDTADTTATFPTGIPTGSTHLPGDGEDDGDETQMLKTQMVSREELELLGRMYEQRRKRKTFGKTALFGFAFLLAVLGYATILKKKPESSLTLPKVDWKKIPIETNTILPGGTNAVKILFWYPVALGAYNTQEEADDVGGPGYPGKIITARTKVGKKQDVPFFMHFSWYDDVNALTNSCEDAFRAWTSRNLRGNLVNQGFRKDHAFIGDKGGLCQGIRCLSCEYSRFADGEKYFGVVSFFRNGRRCFVFRREVPDDEKVRAVRLLGYLNDFVEFDSSGYFSEAHWEGVPPSAIGGAGRDAFSNCERLLKIDSSSDWPVIENGLYGILSAADFRCDAETKEKALGLLLKLRERKQLKWKELRSQRKQAGYSADKVRCREIDIRVRDAFNSEDDARHYRVLRKGWWQ